MNVTPERLSQKKGALAVAIMRFSKLRGKVLDKKIAVVEGDEDSAFYSTMFNRLGVKALEIFFVAKGKDNVLGLRNHLENSKEVPKGDGTIFLIDRDFDGLKEWPAGDDIYVTPTYSIENIVVSKTALRCLLLAEFKLGDADTYDDAERIICLFDGLLRQHETALAEANRIIHFVRRKSLAGHKCTSGSIDEHCWKFAELDHLDLSVKQMATGPDLLSLISVSRHVDQHDLDSLRDDFDALNPAKEWRGKFIFYLFRRFISVLSEDRNCKTPRFFSKGGGKVSLDTSSISFVRTLASLCDVPECLVDFVNQAFPRAA